MSQLELLKLVLAILDRLQIPAMLVGSHASSFYGEARTTHDVDLFLSQNSPRDVAAMKRRQTAEWLGLEVPIIAPEDLIIAKLWWAEMQGGSDRQSQDIAGVLRRQRSEIDLDYLRRELAAVGLGHCWQELAEQL